VGISAGVILLFQSLVTFAVSPADFSLPSLHPKIPFPRSDCGRPKLKILFPGVGSRRA